MKENYSNSDSKTYEYINGKLSNLYFDGNTNDDVDYNYNSEGVLISKDISSSNYHQAIAKNLFIENIDSSQEVHRYTKIIPNENGNSYPIDVESYHFGKLFNVKYDEYSVEYSNDFSSFNYYCEIDGDERNILSEIQDDNLNFNVRNDFDDENHTVNRYYESLNDSQYSFFTKYNEKNQVVSIKNEYYDSELNIEYTYDEKGQLIKSNGTNNCEYEYDERGNIVSKSVNGEKSDFAYSQDGWKDRLLSVNGVPITYDDMGNPVSYGDTRFEWKAGRNLSRIASESDEIGYDYDDNGIRIVKTVNGVKTFYNNQNGKVLSQQDTDGNFIYFQYDTCGSPIGMLYNERQYYYVTNQFGDVTAIIDNDGYVVCEYVYGDWGEILDITGDLEIAEANPLRYRGYYYDNETGYYYLQSRYYDPNICRFINADIFSLVSIDTLLGINIFIYCQNDPINFIDPTGYKSEVTDIGRIIAVVINEIFICLDMQEIARRLNITFEFKSLSEYMDIKVDIYDEAFESGLIGGQIKFQQIFNDALDFFSGTLDYIRGLPELFVGFISAIATCTDIQENFSGRYLSLPGALIVTVADIIVSGIIDVSSAIIANLGFAPISYLFNLLASRYYDKTIKPKAKFLAYNWFYWRFTDWSEVLV